MRVLHISPYMHPSAGGPPVVVERLLELAHANDWTGSVLTTSLFCEDDGQALANDLNMRVKAKVLKVDRPRWRGLASQAEALIAAEVRRADIVHLHTLWHPLNTIARCACQRERRPYVVMPHGMLDPYSLGVHAIRKSLYLRLRERANLSNAACIVFTSHIEENLARGELPWLGESEVIGLGSDPPSAAREELAKDFLARFPESAGRRILLFLGRVHPKKGVELLISALPRVVEAFGDTLLVIAGSGEVGYSSALRKSVRQKGLDRSVLFTGMLLGRRKWEALAAAELFVLPSRQENFALAAAEAMAIGVPVIVSDRVNLWPDVEECAGGVVVKHFRLADRLDKVIISRLADCEETIRMGGRAKTFAEDRYDWRKTARATYSLYERILQKAPA